MADGSTLQNQQAPGYSSLNWGPLANLGGSMPNAPKPQLGQPYPWGGQGAGPGQGPGYWSGDPGGTQSWNAWPQLWPQQQQQQPQQPGTDQFGVPFGSSVQTVSSATSPGAGWQQDPNAKGYWENITTPPPSSQQPAPDQPKSPYQPASPYQGLWGGGGGITGMPGMNPYTASAQWGQPSGEAYNPTMKYF